MSTAGALPGAFLRPVRPGDRDAVYDVCVRTGDAGGDARGLYVDDELLGDAWAGPYLALTTGLGLVLDDGAGRAVGYVVGTADTAAFVVEHRRTWVPHLRSRRPAPADPPSTPSEQVLDVGLHPERMLRAEAAGHPAHLHVDLLPSHQGAGYGRTLVEAFLAAVAAAGAPGLHLGVARSNVRAQAFYRRLGFAVLAQDDGGLLLGRATVDGISGPSRPG